MATNKPRHAKALQENTKQINFSSSIQLQSKTLQFHNFYWSRTYEVFPYTTFHIIYILDLR